MSEDENAAHAVNIIDSGDRTEAQKAAINRIGQGVANLMASAPDVDVMTDVVVSVLVSAALNCGGDEYFIGVVLSECMKVFPLFKAARDARQAGPKH